MVQDRIQHDSFEQVTLQIFWQPALCTDCVICPLVSVRGCRLMAAPYERRRLQATSVLVWEVCTALARLLWPTSATDESSSQASYVTLAVPGVTLPLGHLPYLFASILLALVAHEGGHALAAAAEGVEVQRVGVLLLLLCPSAYVQIDDVDLAAASCWATLKVRVLEVCLHKAYLFGALSYRYYLCLCADRVRRRVAQSFVVRTMRCRLASDQCVFGAGRGFSGTGCGQPAIAFRVHTGEVPWTACLGVAFR